MSLYCPLVSTLLSAANPERQERDLEREGVGEWGIGPNLLPTWSWLPFSQAPRSRVDMKLGLLSRSQLQTSHSSHQRKWGVGFRTGFLEAYSPPGVWRPRGPGDSGLTMVTK